MSCSGCAHNVEEMLSEIEGVVSANVDIVTGTAQVEMKEHISNDKPKKLRGAEALLHVHSRNGKSHKTLLKECFC